MVLDRDRRTAYINLPNNAVFNDKIEKADVYLSR